MLESDALTEYGTSDGNLKNRQGACTAASVHALALAAPPASRCSMKAPAFVFLHHRQEARLALVPEGNLEVRTFPPIFVRPEKREHGLASCR